MRASPLTAVQPRQFRFDHVFGPNTSQGRWLPSAAAEARVKAHCDSSRFHCLVMDTEAIFASAEPLITSLLDGYNVCVMAYGRTAAGKTYTLMGPHAAVVATSPTAEAPAPLAVPGHTSTRDAHRGLIPRSIQRLFQQMRGMIDTYSFKVSVCRASRRVVTGVGMC